MALVGTTVHRSDVSVLHGDRGMMSVACQTVTDTLGRARYEPLSTF